MDSHSFVRVSRQQVSRIVRYIGDQAPGMVVGKTLRFIDGNFRAQGFQGNKFEPWKKNRRNGTILVKSGALRRGTNYGSAGFGTVRFYNNVKYAGIHNRGGTINKRVQVKAHDRKKRKGFSPVKAHDRNMNLVMPKRQFAPYPGSESQVLNKAITRELARDINKILNFK